VAVQSVAAGQATSKRIVVTAPDTAGTALVLQVVPFQCSIRPLVSCVPAAQQLLVVRQVTP
jgi:hypothetical protein